MDFRWFGVVGLLCDILGAVWIGKGLITMTGDKVVELEGPLILPASREEALDLPKAKDRLEQANDVKWGTGLLVLGFVLQLVSAWPH